MLFAWNTTVKTLENFWGKSEKENIHSQTTAGKEDGIKNQREGKQEKEMEGNGVNNIGEQHFCDAYVV